MDHEPKLTPCGLCGRGYSLLLLTQHHCLPRSKGGTVEDIELLCSQCHGMVHATYTNQTLSRVYSTIDELRRAPELAAYIRWVRKQPTTRKKRNKDRKRKL
jgi:5-methylcytosine-specific restriction protein A